MEEYDPIAALKEVINEIFDFYTSVACPCAFPRFREVVSIDCIDYSMAFMCYETELLINRARAFYGESWTCPTCGSAYDFQWEDFSIHVSRSCLKVRDLKALDRGAPVRRPILLYRGFSGHGIPRDPALFLPVDLQEFKAYMTEI